MFCKGEVFSSEVPGEVNTLPWGEELRCRIARLMGRKASCLGVPDICRGGEASSPPMWDSHDEPRDQLPPGEAMGDKSLGRLSESNSTLAKSKLNWLVPGGNMADGELAGDFLGGSDTESWCCNILLLPKREGEGLLGASDMILVVLVSIPKRVRYRYSNHTEAKP